MEREGFDLPLLIGGATTSRVHTAVKIEPNYQRGQTVYVLDASRARRRGAPACCRRSEAAEYVAEIRAEYRQDRRAACARAGRQAARCRSPRRAPTRSARLERLRAAEAELPRHAQRSTTTTWPSWCRYIDWTPFFQTWELIGRYPAILDDDKCRRGGARAVRRRPGDAEADRRRELAHAPAA